MWMLKRQQGTGTGERGRAKSSGVSATVRSPFPVLRSLGAARAKGFTLLEMLAVIVLIGIIGAVVVTQVGKNVDKGKYGAGKAQLTTLSQKIENYALDNGSPPAQLQDLLVKPGTARNWQGPYAKESELKDPWGHAFGYKYPGDHGSFDLIFYGQDGQPGGDGYNADVGNWQ
jgi:general secretion pathway protein G